MRAVVADRGPGGIRPVDTTNRPFASIPGRAGVGRLGGGAPPARSQSGGDTRDASLRAAGMPRRDRERDRAYERERSRLEADRRRAARLCLHCGKSPAVEGCTACEPCAEARRARERAKYAKAKAEGKLYGGRKVETRRRIGRERSRKRDETRRAAERALYASRRAVELWPRPRLAPRAFTKYHRNVASSSGWWTTAEGSQDRSIGEASRTASPSELTCPV